MTDGLARTAHLLGNRAFSARMGAQRPGGRIVQRYIDYGKYRSLVASSQPEPELLTRLKAYSADLARRKRGSKFYEILVDLDLIEQACVGAVSTPPANVDTAAHSEAVAAIRAAVDQDKRNFKAPPITWRCARPRSRTIAG
jgi:hypothetical protein